jgi:hypothetical protein
MTLKIEIRVELIKIGPPYKNMYIIYISDLIKFRKFDLKIARFYDTIPQLILLNFVSTKAWGWLQTALKNIFACKLADMGQQ